MRSWISSSRAMSFSEMRSACGREALDHGAQLAQFLQVLFGEPCDVVFPVLARAVDVDQALRDQAVQCLAHRCTTDADVLHQLLFLEKLAFLQLPGNNVLLDRFVGLVHGPGYSRTAHNASTLAYQFRLILGCRRGGGVLHATV